MDQKELTAENRNDSFSALLDGILSNPEMLSMISSMADKLKNGSLSADTEAHESTKAPEEQEAAPNAKSVEAGAIGQKLPDMLSTLAPLLSNEFSKSSPQNDNRTCLLRALKPYLSSGRSEAVEYIIKISRLSDILKNLS